jgi:hypothetical protein
MPGRPKQAHARRPRVLSHGGLHTHFAVPDHFSVPGTPWGYKGQKLPGCDVDDVPYPTLDPGGTPRGAR